MSRWSGRAQVEPLAALAAVFAVGVALSAYAGVLDETIPMPDRELAEPTVERVHHLTSDAGVLDPESLEAGAQAGPDGYRMNLTLTAAGRTWSVGPPAPESADAAATTTSVRVAPGRIRPGRLRAEVWR